MNIFNKAIMLLIISTLVLTGCNFGKNPEDTTPDSDTSAMQQNQEAQETEEKGSKPEEQKDDIKEALPAEDEDAFFKIGQSKKNNGWQQLILKDQSFTTTDWESFSFEEDAPMVTYSIDFPGDWGLEFSVFYNERQEKVAELFPAITMEPGQELLDNWESPEENEVISKEEIEVGDLSGMKIVSRVYPSGGDINEWYSYTYYLTDGTQVFAIAFYDLEQDSVNVELYEKMIDTIEFK